MRTIEIDEDIYVYLLSKTIQIGESASSILRRELKLNGQARAKKAAIPTASHELGLFLRTPTMRFGNATDKFLAVLAEVHQHNPKDFERVLSIQGRGRVYFARSKEEIIRSGRSTQPRQIPGTPFWVMTNSPTPQKRAMLRKALELLGYSQPACADAAGTL
jgi:negative modulator of initiation of replication